jgi:hypothetical protein
MTARIVHIELRRSVALGAAIVIAAAGAFVLFASNPPYRSWMELVILQRDIMQLTWPLALAAGAWQGVRERRSRVEELIATTPRPRWWRVLPVATAMAIAAVAAYAVMLAGAAVHLRHPAAYFPTGAVPLIALGALALVAAVWLGLAVGALLPSPLTAPMLAVIGFFALVLSPMLVAQKGGDPGTFLLFPYLQGPPDGGFSWKMLSARANLSQALWLAAVAAAGLALFAAARPGTRVAAVVPVLLGAAIAVPAMPRHLTAAWIEDHRATEEVCTSDEPQVCIARVHSYALDELRGPARQALSVLTAKLPLALTRVLVQDLDDPTPRGPRSAETLVVSAQLNDVDGSTGDDLMWIMLDGAGVPPCEKLRGLPDDIEARYVAARLAAAAWLLDKVPPGTTGRAGEEPAVALANQALAALRVLPAHEQRAHVATLRQAEWTCAVGDRLALLTGATR